MLSPDLFVAALLVAAFVIQLVERLDRTGEPFSVGAFFHEDHALASVHAKIEVKLPQFIARGLSAEYVSLREQPPL